MYDINDVPIGRVNIAVSTIMNEAVARAHKENGIGYTPMSRFTGILREIMEEIERGINDRMYFILKAEKDRETNANI